MAEEKELNINEKKKIKIAKKKALEVLNAKVEQTKLDLIYTELEEANIKFERNYSSVKELQKDLNKQLGELDRNRLSIIIENINSAIDSTVTCLENGSTNAFTKLMTGDLMKTIAKTLGISLAGRTALLLAPTIGTKAIVGVGMGAYSLYRVIKNRKDIIKANENNELNNILMELEYTKVNGKYIDTRFDVSKQEDIRRFLADNNIIFEDTGYRSLRQVIYGLSPDIKRGLCELLNNKYGKGIEITERIAKAKKKLNVIASTASTVGVGATLGTSVATMINSVDPAITTATINGTLLGLWTQLQEGNPWLSTLSGTLTAIGTAGLEWLPWGLGEFFENVFATENIAVLTTLGATGGLIVGTTLSLISAGLQVKKSFDNKANVDEFNKLDKEKYQEEDKAELKVIRDKLYNPPNFMESIIIDIVMGYLNDRDITIEGVPKTIFELRDSINKLEGNSKKEAHKIIAIIAENIDKDPSFIEKLKYAGKATVGMLTAGLAVLSVYDIVKGGTFLPELSQTLFPENNIYTPVPIPDPLTQPFDPNNATEQELIEHNQKFFEQFKGDEYMVENHGNQMIQHGATMHVNDSTIAGMGAGQAVMEGGMAINAAPQWMLDFLDWFAELCGHELPPDFIPNVPLITEKFNELSPEQLYNFYRYFNSIENDGSPIYAAISEVLGYKNIFEKATGYITDFEIRQKINDFVNKSADIIGNGSIPLSVIYELLGFKQSQDYSDKLGVQSDEIKNSGFTR